MTTSAPRLREATRADVPAMRGVRAAVRENRLSSPDRIGAAQYDDAFRDGCGWVVEADARVLGFAFGLRDGNVWALFVDPAHEGRGHGSTLHEALLDWLRRHARRPLWLTTAPGTRAEAFYRARGWQERGPSSASERRLEWTGA